MEMMEGLSLRNFALQHPLSLHHRLYGHDILFNTIDDMQQFYVFLLSSIMAQYKYNHGDRTTNNIFLSFLQTETAGSVIVSPYLFDFGRSHEINKGLVVQDIEYTEHIQEDLIHHVNEEYRTILEQIYKHANTIPSISKYIEEQLKEADCDYVYLMQLLSAYVIDDVDIDHKSSKPTYSHINSELFAFYNSMQGAETYLYLFDIDEHKKITLNNKKITFNKGIKKCIQARQNKSLKLQQELSILEMQLVSEMSQIERDSEKPRESQIARDSKKPSESAKERDSEKASESAKTSESAKPSESQKARDSKKARESAKRQRLSEIYSEIHGGNGILTYLLIISLIYNFTLVFVYDSNIK